MIEKLKALPVELGPPVNLVADTGYFSAANVEACGEQNITPLIAVARETHHPDSLARFTELVTGSGKGQRRIEVGGDGVELEADVYPCGIV